MKIYRRHIVGAFLLFVLVLLLSYKSNICVKPHVAGSALTFLSIVFGFYLTSLSVLYGSAYARILSKAVDPRMKSQTKIQTLIAYYKVCTYMVLVSVSFFIGYEFDLFLICSELESKFMLLGVEYPLGSVMSALFNAILITNMYFIFLLLRVFINAFLVDSGDGFRGG